MKKLEKLVKTWYGLLYLNVRLSRYRRLKIKKKSVDAAHSCDFAFCRH